MSRFIARTAIGVISLLMGVLGLSINAQAAPTFAHANAPDLPDIARGVPMGGALRVFDLQLDQSGPTTLELKRFSVFAPDAKIEVVNGPSASVPDVAYFQGWAANDPESVVMLAIPEKGKGKIHGVVTGTAGAWMLDSKPGNSGLKTRKVDLGKDLAGRTFECGADGSKISSATSAASSGGTESAGLGGIPPVNVLYTGHMIIDTDYEYWLQFWNLFATTADGTVRAQQAAAAATEYLGDLLAYASAAYEREINTNLRISYLRLFADDTDPYSANTNACGCTGAGKLDEVQDVWDGIATPRTLVHFISGKSEGCGCAYTGVLCSQASGYGASSQIGPGFAPPGFNIDSPGFLWEGMVIAHEIGHNFNSQHTHQYCNEYSIAEPVDVCVDNVTPAPPNSVPNCFGSDNASLPGLGSLSGGVTSNHPGTIMSYCHLQGGGLTNIAHTFGLTHPYGIAAWRVPNKMLAHVQGSTACMSLQYTGSDLQVTKDCKPDDPMAVGDIATCTIRVKNLGPDLAQGVVVKDQILSNGTFTINAVTASIDGTAQPASTCTTTPNPQNGAATVTCNLDLLDAGHEATIVVPVTAATVQNINDTATVTSDSEDPNPANNSASDTITVVVAQADVVVTKTCKPNLQEEPFHVGDDNRGKVLPYCEIIATNHGPAAARNVVLEDRIIADSGFSVAGITFGGTTCAPGIGGPFTSRTITCNPVPSLAKDASISLRVTYNANQAVAINDTAEVTTTGTQDPDPDNNQAHGAVQILGTADLSITKSDSPDPVTAGQNLTYTLTVNNGGPSPAQGVVVTDVLPAGVSLVSVTPSVGTCGGTSTITCNLGNLANGDSATITIVVKVLPETRGQLDNSAEVASSTYDWNNGNNKATASTTVTPTAGLSVTKTDVPDPVAAGAVLEYRLTVSNGGPSTATQVVLTDTLPSQVVFQSAVDGNGATICAHSAGQVTCNLGTLPPGAVVQVFIKVLVSASVPDGTTLTNTAKVVSFEDSTGATATAETLVNAVADLWLDKVSNFPTGNPSGTIVYNLYIYNKPGCEQNSGSGNVDPADCWNSGGGPSDAQNVVVTDTLPLDPKKFVVQYVSPNCVYDKVSVTHKVTCKVADTGGTPIPLPAGAVAGPFQIQAVVKGSNGTFTNTATVTSDTTDPNLVNNTDVVKTTVQGGTGKKGGGR